MKYMRSVASIVVFLFLGSCSNDSSENDPGLPANNLTLESNRISCQACEGFGEIITTDENFIYVGGLKNVWVFERKGSSFTLIQEIALGQLLELNSIRANATELFLGVHNEFGDGILQRYRKMGAIWEFEKAYAIGRSLDNFGNDIDLSNDYMVVGASAPWSNTVDVGNLDAGSIHIFKSTGDDWMRIQDFNAQDSFADDRYGTDVLLWENFILASGLSIPLHLYQLENDTWSLLRIEENIIVADLARHGNIIMYYSEQSGLRSFRINQDGSFDFLNVGTGLSDSGGIQFGGDNISMLNEYALFRYYGGNRVHLLKLDGDTWRMAESFNPSSSDQFQYFGIHLTSREALLAGVDPATNTAYIFFEEY